MRIHPYLKNGLWLAGGLILTLLFRFIPSLSRIYADYFYPAIRVVLNGFSSLFPFSLYDVFICISIIALIGAIVLLCIRKTRKKAFGALLLAMGWLYIAFYWVWGINYFSPDFMSRNGLQHLAFDSIKFNTFLSEYADALNKSYTPVPSYDNEFLRNKIQTSEKKIESKWNFPSLPATASVKPMLFGSLYAAMGIRGYYGPFFAEAHVNPNYLPHERPFVTAHELGHLAGITSEAEANLYAYLITTESDNPAIRFSGYYSILPYVLINARKNLSEEAYAKFRDTLDPRILELYNDSRMHWRSLYSPQLGKIQGWLYESYLKNNNIQDGQANYSEVIRLLMSIRFAQ